MSDPAGTKGNNESSCCVGLTGLQEVIHKDVKKGLERVQIKDQDSVSAEIRRSSKSEEIIISDLQHTEKQTCRIHRTREQNRWEVAIMESHSHLQEN